MAMKFLVPVFRIMRLQCEPVRLAILLALREGAKSSDEVRRITEQTLSPQKVPNSTFLHHSLELIKEDLSCKKSEDSYELTPLGTTSLDALQKYQDSVLESLLVARQIRAESELGPEAAEIVAQAVNQFRSAGPVFKPIPAALRIMRIQSDPARLAVLLSLSSDAAHPMGLQELLHSVQLNLERDKIPGSTLSNILFQLERDDLITRGPRASVRLTTFGEDSVRAFNVYKESIEHALRTSLAQRIAEDLGIDAATLVQQPVLDSTDTSSSVIMENNI